MVRRKFTLSVLGFLGVVDSSRLEKIVLTDDFEALVCHLATSVVPALRSYFYWSLRYNKSGVHMCANAAFRREIPVLRLMTFSRITSPNCCAQLSYKVQERQITQEVSRWLNG